ncbi:hypothetical protein GCM10010156_67650 [Planobispora rosea]|uniref:Uncharacterized protein n=1 Tax=Planobispora rosea TaxID=35762 RepID=A0A8J3WG75_PLARO|nr:hypothetical protein [Planobispora rosea]GGT00034.1 hypothetical protein GCM10010156_67650 [Planobispora rosea]GIH88128.1 hypothetical protein Pro02_65360 [Planobispora rosea]
MISVYADLAIGLVLAFLLLSLLVSGVNEAFVRLLGIRSKFLWAYLRDTMDGGSSEGTSWIPSKIADVFAKLPFSKNDPRPRHSPDPAPPVVAPMPVDPATVLAAEAPVPDVDMTERLYRRLQEIDHPKGARTTISDIPPERFSGAVMELVSAEEGGVEGLIAKLEAIHSPLAGHLRGVWKGAEADMEKFRAGVESWFDGEMQRLSGLYRRYVKWVVFALGVALTLLFSMDALEYGKTLLRDNAFRAGVAAIAGGSEDGLTALKDKCSADGAAEPYECVTESLSSPALVKIFDNAIVSITVPPEGGDPSLNWNGGVWWDRLITPGHWPGYLLTAVALLFGAPFWWDVLRRLTGFRNRG